MTKFLTNKINMALLQLISQNQTTFILDNTLLADKMLYDFGRKRTLKRFCLSIDLRNVFDIVK